MSNQRVEYAVGHVPVTGGAVVDSSTITTKLPSGMSSHPASFVRNPGGALVAAQGESVPASASLPDFTKKMLQSSADNPFSSQYSAKNAPTFRPGWNGNVVNGPFFFICLTKRDGVASAIRERRWRATSGEQVLAPAPFPAVALPSPRTSGSPNPDILKTTL
jgi:hypothetical protein